ncbi:MAG: peptidoglycan hydrolase-like protein with peptidoglycan-binding domain [Ilumatobacter sp.]|jgi:peptidoglycan hydrolase-like protein with peptidoglycan-binding domain
MTSLITAADRPSVIDDELRRRRRRRRSWPWLLIGAGAGAAATVGVQQWTSIDEADAVSIRTETVALATAQVTSYDFVEFIDYSGELSLGVSTSVLATASGTVTESVPVGTLLERGSAAISIDAVPVVAFYGSQPFYRGLELGDDGSDVLQLEANLRALGFTADGELSVDGEYDSDTVDAVEAWEAAFGVEETGNFDAGRVVVLAGPTVVSEIAERGMQIAAGQQLLLGETIEARTDVTFDAGTVDGTSVIDNIAVIGTEIKHGSVLATVDGEPVFAVTEVSSASALILDALGSDDTEYLENLLVFFGFDPSGSIVVDEEVELATFGAMNRWHTSIGLPNTAVVGSLYYVVVPEDRVVVEVLSAAGDWIGAGALVLSLASPTTSVTTDIVVDEIDDIEVGEPLEVVLADERILTGSVSAIAGVADDAGDGSVPTIAIEVAVDEVPDDVIVGPVTIRFEIDRIAGATVVPTRALISLSEGGFAVEVRTPDGSTRLVGVELGVFDDGVVEVIAGDVTPGDDVVVPT